jgi:hypothetical protein
MELTSARVVGSSYELPEAHVVRLDALVRAMGLSARLHGEVVGGLDLS